jgi:hypothetical protein
MRDFTFGTKHCGGDRLAHSRRVEAGSAHAGPRKGSPGGGGRGFLQRRPRGGGAPLAVDLSFANLIGRHIDPGQRQSGRPAGPLRGRKIVERLVEIGDPIRQFDPDQCSRRSSLAAVIRQRSFSAQSDLFVSAADPFRRHSFEPWLTPPLSPAETPTGPALPGALPSVPRVRAVPPGRWHRPMHGSEQRKRSDTASHPSSE